MFATRATLFFLKGVKTPTKLSVKSGPFISFSFKEVSLNFAAQSKTTLSLPGLRGLTMGESGTYHTVDAFWISSSVISWTYPSLKYD